MFITTLRLIVSTCYIIDSFQMCINKTNFSDYAVLVRHNYLFDSHQNIRIETYILNVVFVIHILFDSDKLSNNAGHM